MHDLLIHGGRVIDPQTGHDAVADVAVSGGRITAVGHVSGEAARTIDASGLAPGPALS